MITAEKLEQHISIDSQDLQPVEVLSQHTALSKSQIKQAMQKGAVWLTHKQHTQRLRRIKKKLHPGDELHIYYNEKILAQQPTPAQLIADENSYSIWYKPYGMYSQGSKWGDHCTIQRWVEQQKQQPTFVVHRLDRAATGLIIIAHQKKAAAQLAALFAERAIDKRYRAIVQGQFPGTPITITAAIENRTAVSHLTKISFEPLTQQSLVEVAIETGRKHQIRRHLADYGYPIIGDRLYGLQGSQDTASNLQLCCVYLAFRCPLSGTQQRYQLDPALQCQLGV